MPDFKELDSVLHQPLRLAVMSVLATVEMADFVYLKEQTKSTAGNLSVQLDRLQTANYISITKDFVGKKPRTRCQMTTTGREALAAYVEALKSYVKL